MKARLPRDLMVEEVTGLTFSELPVVVDARTAVKRKVNLFFRLVKVRSVNPRE